MERWTSSEDGAKDMKVWLKRNLMLNMIFEQEEGQGSGQAARMARKQFQENADLVLGLVEEEGKKK